MTPHRLSRFRVVAGACLLSMAGMSQASAQFVQTPRSANQAFPPPPSQTTAFPPPPGQAQAFPPPAAQPQAFPPPSAAPGGFPPPQSGGFSPVPGMGAPQQSPSDVPKVCLNFPALGRDMEEGLKAVNDAGQRKASREEACPLFKSLVARENKALKFLETNRTLCQIPPNFIKQLADRHANILKITKVVCAAAPPGAAGPSLSDALGGPIIADDTSAKLPGRGTFDTLTGNALQR
jgi:hypothetical protein